MEQGTLDFTTSAEVLDYDQLWPNVRGGYWCGEFELADDREVAD